MSSASINGIDICYETLGNPNDQCLLLIAGFGQQLTDWDDEFCQRLVELGLYVVRFDNRDSGLSSHFHEFQNPDLRQGLQGNTSSAGYILDDFATDALELLAYLHIESAHLFGVSMGGMIAQIMAIRAPERVRSLFLLSTNPGDPKVGQPAPEIQAAPFLAGKSDDEIDNAVASSGRWASWALGVTETSLRARITRRIQRSYDPLAALRQLVAIVATPDRSKALGVIDIPTLVMHGTEDPMVDVSGGRALAALIPSAELILIDQLRHDMPSAIWPEIMNGMTRLRRRADKQNN